MEENLASEEIHLYLEYSRRDLDAARSNLNAGYYHIVVSRSYYAMFYAANALLSSKDITRSKHSGVLSAFGEFFVKTGLIETQYAKMFGNAFTARLVSDYDVITTTDKSTAEDILNDANRFVLRVEKHFRESGK